MQGKLPSLCPPIFISIFHFWGFYIKSGNIKLGWGPVGGGKLCRWQEVSTNPSIYIFPPPWRYITHKTFSPADTRYFTHTRTNKIKYKKREVWMDARYMGHCAGVSEEKSDDRLNELPDSSTLLRLWLPLSTLHPDLATYFIFSPSLMFYLIVDKKYKFLLRNTHMTFSHNSNYCAYNWLIKKSCVNTHFFRIQL